MRRVGKVLGVTTVAAALVAAAFFYGRATAPPDKVYADPIFDDDTPTPTHGTVDLLAVTPNGTKIYKIVHPKAVVPVIVVEGRSGQVTVR